MKSEAFAIIPARNESRHIAKVIEKTKKYRVNIVVVDDGSTDGTKDIAESCGAKVISHITNLGKGAAVNTGCEYAISKGAKRIILIDSDGQHDPKEIPRFLRNLKTSDLVFGVRRFNSKMPFVMRFGNLFITKTAYLLFNVDIKDTQCGYRAFNSSTYKKIRWKSRDYSMESEMIANAGKNNIKYSQLPIDTIYSDNYKGTTVIDGIKIVLNMLWWKMVK